MKEEKMQHFDLLKPDSYDKWDDPEFLRQIKEEEYRSLVWTRNVQEGISTFARWYLIGWAMFILLIVLCAI